MSRRRILVVEDNPKNLKLVRDVLQYAGFEVVEATSGEEGVATGPRDAARPGPDGPQLPGHRRRRGAAPDPGIRRDAGAGGRRDGVRDEGRTGARPRDAGFDGYLEKPISVRALPAAGARLPRAEEARR